VNAATTHPEQAAAVAPRTVPAGLRYADGTPAAAGDLVAQAEPAPTVFTVLALLTAGTATLDNTAPGVYQRTVLPTAVLTPVGEEDLFCRCCGPRRPDCPRHGLFPDHDLAPNPLRSAALRYALDRHTDQQAGVTVGKTVLAAMKSATARNAVAYLARLSWGAWPGTDSTWNTLDRHGIIGWAAGPAGPVPLLTDNGRRMAARIDLIARLETAGYARRPA
jgi:hypothetical protein